jgi:hypothetical protein
VALGPARVAIAAAAPLELNLKSFVVPKTGEDLGRWRYSGGKLGAFNLTQVARRRWRCGQALPKGASSANQ